MVIRADSEAEAREVAQEHAQAETRISGVHHSPDVSMRNREVWTDESLVECVPISEYEDDGPVLMQDVSMA
jgi:hypothetical protein